MSRTTKQIVYGCVYGIIFVLLLRGAYIAIFTSYQTCFDNLQNQGEERVDCGGPCPACAGPVYEPLAIVDQIFTFTAVPGRAVVFAKVKNTNREYMARRVEYVFSILNSGGSVLGRVNGNVSIPASSEKYIFGSTEINFTGIKDVYATLRFMEPEWGLLGNGVEQTLSLPFDVTTKTDGTAVRVEGTLKNSNYTDVNEVEVLVLLRDRSDFHDPLYAGKTVIRVRGMSENRFSVVFPPSSVLSDRVDPELTEVFTNIQ